MFELEIYMIFAPRPQPKKTIDPIEARPLGMRLAHWDNIGKRKGASSHLEQSPNMQSKAFSDQYSLSTLRSKSP